MSKLGFIGLGIMGKPMALHLIEAGHEVFLFNRTREPVEELAARGGKPCSSSREVAEKSEIIFIIVPDTPDVENVIFGTDGIIEGIRSGSIVVDMSSISPVATRDFAGRLKDKGAHMIDAPVSGGQAGAEQGTLSIMAGGDKEIFEMVHPLLEIMGKKITLVGGNGAGQTCKMANQVIVAGTIQIVAEALLLASKAGADPAAVREALLGGFAQSRILEVHGERMLKRNFKPGFKISLQQKDLNIALQTGRTLGLSMNATALAQELYNSVAAHGGSDMDHSSMILALERMANYKMYE